MPTDCDVVKETFFASQKSITLVLKQIPVSDKAGMPIEEGICELIARLGWFLFLTYAL